MIADSIRIRHRNRESYDQVIQHGLHLADGVGVAGAAGDDDAFLEADDGVFRAA